MRKSRTRNSFLNMVVSVILNVLTILIGLIVQKLFLSILNEEYLGLNSLFSNILSMLSIAELGISNAVIFSLYKPIAKDDKETIKSLLRFYRTSYAIIGCVILTIGLIIMPFLPNLIENHNLGVDINVIYLLSLADVVISYFISYKRSILFATQQNYIIDLIHIFYTIIVNTTQILILFLTKNYYLYVIDKIVFRIIENFLIILIANKKYAYLTEKDVKPLDKNIKKDIFKKIKALFIHKIGGFIVLGTDNIIITKFLGLAINGLYSSYFLIINAIQSVVGQIVASTTASIGDLLASNNDDKKHFEVFKKIRFINFWLACVTTVGIFVVMKSFIIVWLGEKYLLSFATLLILSLNHYQTISRRTYTVFKDAAGIYHEDRFIPIIESILNIAASIALVLVLGLPGVFIGTIISSLPLWFYSFPKFVYKKLFKRSFWQYFKENFIFLFITIISCAAAFGLSEIISPYTTPISLLIINIVITLVVPNIIILVVYRKNSELRYYLDLMKAAKNTIVKKIRK